MEISKKNTIMLKYNINKTKKYSLHGAFKIFVRRKLFV